MFKKCPICEKEPKIIEKPWVQCDNKDCDIYGMDVPYNDWIGTPVETKKTATAKQKAKFELKTTG